MNMPPNSVDDTNKDVGVIEKVDFGNKSVEIVDNTDKIVI